MRKVCATYFVPLGTFSKTTPGPSTHPYLNLAILEPQIHEIPDESRKAATAYGWHSWHQAFCTTLAIRPGSTTLFRVGGWDLQDNVY